MSEEVSDLYAEVADQDQPMPAQEAQVGSESLVSRSVEAGRKYLKDKIDGDKAWLEMFLESGNVIRPLLIVNSLAYNTLKFGPLISHMEQKGIDLSPSGLGKDAVALAVGWLMANIAPLGGKPTGEYREELLEDWKARRSGNLAQSDPNSLNPGNLT